MNVYSRNLSLLAVVAVVVAALGCSQNNDKKSVSETKASKAAQNVVIRESNGVKEYALVDGPAPTNAANPDEALMQSLNWQPLTEEMAMQASHKVNPSQISDDSYKVIPNPSELFAQAAKEKEEGTANWIAYGYGYPTYYPSYGYYNYYYPTYGYNNWFWPSYAYSSVWAYSYNYWPTYYNSYNWWYYQPAYQYNYWGYNYYWYARWW